MQQKQTRKLCGNTLHFFDILGPTLARIGQAAAFLPTGVDHKVNIRAEADKFARDQTAFA